ncbi:hypothetical protein QO010_003883 [Caulobacter ginsengisoli]|uniref:DUF4440 domain-containing protein n=1 Tax=Caulobacter ginsengisoli TaxID=400775 RepID=A0ABU0IVP1_9CAUL|nr:nuclear transport factor 2 family protein [Caulobacter ginsengisoli]MDQ0466090.1 hypothetical protein [Caulobacter ginsengisoli]
MRHSILLLVVVAALGASAPAPIQPPPEKALLQAEDGWMAAMQRRDRSALERYLAPEFSLGGIGEPERDPLPRAVWLGNAIEHLKVDTVRFDQSRVTVWGDTAQVHAIFTWSGAYEGEAFTDKVTLIDTWVRRDGRWQVVSRLVEAYRPPEP